MQLGHVVPVPGGEFERNADDYRSADFKEAEVRQQFINPFFKCLGWDMDTERGDAEAYKDVVLNYQRTLPRVAISSTERARSYTRTSSISPFQNRPFAWEFSPMQTGSSLVGMFVVVTAEPSSRPST